MDFAQVLAQFAADLRTPVRGLCDWIREDRGALREDFSELKNIVAELAVAQLCTEALVGELTETQRRNSEEMRLGFKALRDSISALGSRWGIMTEATFRATIEGILSRTGYRVERGYYGSREIDVAIRNGEHLLLEICSVLKKSDIPKLVASAADYEAREGIRPRLLIAATRIPRAARLALEAAEKSIEVFSWDEEED